MQDTIDAHPHRELLFTGLHVDVGRTQVHRLGEQVVHELDDGRFFRHLPKLPGAVARVQALDRLLLPDEIQETVDVVVGGQAEGHGPARMEVVEGFEQGVIQDVAGDAEEVLVSRLHISTALSRNHSSLTGDPDMNRYTSRLSGSSSAPCR